MPIVLSVEVVADAASVFRSIAEIELWPALIPDYRSARVVRRSGQHRVVEATTATPLWPLSWTAIQHVDRDNWTVTLRHVRGLTRGMIVAWRVDPRAPGRVKVTAELRRAERMSSGARSGRLTLAYRILRPLTERTLRRLKRVAEGGTLAGRA